MQSKWFLGWGCTLQIQTHWILYQPMSRPRMFRTFGEVLLRSGISLGRESFGLYVMVIKSNSEKVSGFKMELSSRRWVPQGHQVSLRASCGGLRWTRQCMALIPFQWLASCLCDASNCKHSITLGHMIEDRLVRKYSSSGIFNLNLYFLQRWMQQTATGSG